MRELSYDDALKVLPPKISPILPGSQPGVYALAVGTPITAAAIAHLIGWVCILDVEEPPA
jgi:hypothetical protein